MWTSFISIYPDTNVIGIRPPEYCNCLTMAAYSLPRIRSANCPRSADCIFIYWCLYKSLRDTAVCWGPFIQIHQWSISLHPVKQSDTFCYAQWTMKLQDMNVFHFLFPWTLCSLSDHPNKVYIFSILSHFRLFSIQITLQRSFPSSLPSFQMCTSLVSLLSF